ncbi:nucleoside hydrolase-like [Ptychodera flava]|uniref:nucleoside hydrolase-like n=1 Tax=Ptychodera flava TaxID=63121 RepID=UPI00396A20E8
MAEKQLMIIDCDAGIDDAQAIMMALCQPHIEVVAITCVAGNVSVQRVCHNVLRVLEVCGKLGKVPVYRGAEGPIINRGDPPATSVHGSDGLGDIPSSGALELEKHASAEHAVNKMIDLVVHQHHGEISLVALGPLTNLALAERMKPGFSKQLKMLSLFGGNTEGRGNTTISAEFNFYMDVEAADIVLQEFVCPVYVTGWEASLKHTIDWEWLYEWLNTKTKKGRFVKAVMDHLLQYYKGEWAQNELGEESNFIVCDQLSMAIAIDDKVVKKAHRHLVRVERQGSITRGQMVVDWCRHLGHKDNLNLVTEIDMQLVKDLMQASLND